MLVLKKMLKHVALLLCVAMLADAADVFAADGEKGPEKAGIVVALSGRAEAVAKDGTKRKLALKSPIFIGDAVKTKSRSKLQVMFKDTTTISIGQKANMVIDDFVFKPGDPRSKCETSITSGAFKILGGSISKMAPDQIKVKTPTATIGIRGTLGIGSASPTMTSAVFMGGNGISVANEFGMQVLSGAPGTGTTAGAGGAPEPPRMFSPKEVSNLMNATAVAAGDNNQQAQRGGGNGPAAQGDDDDDDDDGGDNGATAQGGDDDDDDGNAPVAQGDDDDDGGDDDGGDAPVAQGDDDDGGDVAAAPVAGGDDDDGGDAVPADAPVAAVDDGGDNLPAGDDGGFVAADDGGDAMFVAVDMGDDDGGALPPPPPPPPPPADVLGGDIGGDILGDLAGDLGEFVDDVAADVDGDTTDAAQSDTGDSADQTANADPDPILYYMEGHTLAALTDQNYGRRDLKSSGDGDESWSTSLMNITSYDGIIDNDSGVPAEAWDGFMGYTANAVVDGGVYTGVTQYKFTIGDSTYLKDDYRDMDIDLYSDNLGDFFYFRRIEKKYTAITYNPDSSVLYNAARPDSANPAYVTDGAITGTTLIAGHTSIIGDSARQFNGPASDIITIADGGSNDMLDFTGSFTMSVWVKFTDSSATTVLEKFNSNTGYELTVDTGKVTETVGDGNADFYQSGTAINNNQWHNVVYVCDRTQDKLILYVDGNYVGEKPSLTSSSDISSAVDLLIGGDGSSAYFTGAIDDLRLYDKELDEGRVKEIWWQATNNKEFDGDSDLVAHYTFDDPNFIYDQLTYAGRPSLDIPTDGVFLYGDVGTDISNSYGHHLVVSQLDPDGGSGSTFSLADGSLMADDGQLSMGINYANNRVIGVLHDGEGDDDDDDHGEELIVFFGNVNDTDGTITATMVNQVTEMENGDYVVLNGNITGQVYGQDNQAVGLNGSGKNNIDLETSNPVFNWDMSAAAFMDNNQSQYDTLSIDDLDRADNPTDSEDGAISLTVGHVAMVSKNTNNNDLTFYRSTNDTGAGFTINYVDGTITACHINATGYDMVGSAQGGAAALTSSSGTAATSAFVSPDLYISLFSTGSAVNSISLSSDEQNRSFAIAYPLTYNSSGTLGGTHDITMADYPWISMGAISAVHYNGSYEQVIMQEFSHFVTGIKAEFGAVSLTSMTGISGTYTGPARGSYMNSNMGHLELVEGVSEFAINFGSESLTSGVISLKGTESGDIHTLTANTTPGVFTIDTSGLHASASAFSSWTKTGVNPLPGGTTITSSVVEASFYNDNNANPITATNAPSSIGGNFSAMCNDGTYDHAIQGVFAGNQ